MSLSYETTEISDEALLDAAVDLLEGLVEKFGPEQVYAAVQRRMRDRVRCNHWHIRECIVGGAVVDAKGRILKDQPSHFRHCETCRTDEQGTLAPDESAKNVFKRLVPGLNRRIHIVDLRNSKNMYIRFKG